MKAANILCVILLMFCANSFADEVYSWEDKNGYHMTDDISKVPKKYRNRYSTDINKQQNSENNLDKEELGSKLKMQLAEIQYKGATYSCIHYFSNNKVQMNSCISRAANAFNADISDIPYIIKSERFKILSNYYGEDKLNQLGKKWWK